MSASRPDAAHPDPLFSEIDRLRERGVGSLERTRYPLLESACSSWSARARSERGDIIGLLKAAIAELGMQDGQAALAMLGLDDAGGRTRTATDRRATMAQILGRSVETVRRAGSWEDRLIEAVVQEVRALAGLAHHAPVSVDDDPTPVAPGEPGADLSSPPRALPDAGRERHRRAVAERARRELKRELANLPYDPQNYVAREEVHRAWRAFLESDSRTFALVGESGRGKTNTLCHLISELDDSVIAVLYNGIDLGSSLIGQILEDLLGAPAETPLHTLRALLEELGVEVVIALDALNSYRGDRFALSRELDALKDVADETMLRVVVSCTESAWRDWRLNGQEETRFARSVFVPDPLRSRRSAGVVLREFTAEELKDACRRRGFRDTELPEQLRQLLAIPEALRLFSTMAPEERSGAGDLPRLIDTFVEEQCRGDKSGARDLIRTLAEIMLDDESLHLPVDHPELVHATEALQLLESKAIVARGENSLSFRSDVMAQHFIGRVVSSRLFLGRDGEAHVDALWSSELEIVTGVVDAALSIAMRDGVDRRRVAACVEEIAEWGPRWEGVVSLAVARDPSVHTGLLIRMCSSESYFIRGTAAQALSGLESMARRARMSDDWRVREAAALSYQYGECEGRRCLQLWGLASDPHWRVRRAVGYALKAVWPRCATHLNRQLRATMADPTSAWHASHAVLIALGSTAPGSAEIAASLDVADFLERCARSENRQVRWLAAYYIPQYPWATDELEETLLTDSDPWIRATLGSSLIEMIAELDSAPTAGLHRLDRLCADPDPGVRIRVARAMCLRQVDVFDRHLEDLARDDNARVRAAVDYSLDPWGLPSVDLAAERIAILDTDPVGPGVRTGSVRTSKFITDRLAIRFVDDPYVHRFETMRALFAATIDEFSAEANMLSEFIDRVLNDPDEGVRWALVLCLVETSLSLDTETIVNCLTLLSEDGHMWVRREVAGFLPTLVDEGRLPVEHGLELVSTMRADDAMTADDFRDEVQPFLDTAEEQLLARLRNIS